MLFYLVPPADAPGVVPGLPALPFNAQTTLDAEPLGIYLLDSSKCSSGAARRITRNNLAQADGEITHRKFKSGYVIELNAQLWETVTDPACAGTLRQMGDLLGEYLEAMANNNGQLIWFPSPWPDDAAAPNPRVLDQARSMGPSGNDATGASFVSVVTEKTEEGKLYDVTFAFLSPLPYVTDFMNYPTSPDETATFATGGGDLGTTIANAGTVPYFPVIRVYGPSDGFQLFNYSTQDEIGNPLSITYDDTLPGAFMIPALSYVEIDMFRDTAILHNAGGGTDNAKTCIDALNSDFFSLIPGANDLFMLWFGSPGVEVQIDYRNAWA